MIRSTLLLLFFFLISATLFGQDFNHHQNQPKIERTSTATALLFRQAGSILESTDLLGCDGYADRSAISCRRGRKNPFFQLRGSQDVGTVWNTGDQEMLGFDTMGHFNRVH